MMEMNSAMRTRWHSSNLETAIKKLELEESLAQLAASPIADTVHGVVLEHLMIEGFRGHSLPDATGFEAFINKIHIGDFIESVTRPNAINYLLAQGVMYSEKIRGRLSDRPEKFRILLSLEPESGEVTVRFYMRRVGESWEAENLESYETEEIIRWDT